jgi:rRNA maturation endonuclease Nob1
MRWLVLAVVLLISCPVYAAHDGRVCHNCGSIYDLDKVKEKGTKKIKLCPDCGIETSSADKKIKIEDN